MFVNTKYFSPVAMDGLTMAPPGSYEYIDWWNTERDRCLNGYTIGGTRITGMHYWYLNYWVIRRQVHGKLGKRLAHPKFLDMDYEFFHAVEETIAMKMDLLVLKRRQAGFSAKSSAIVGYDASFLPDSYTIITSGQEEYSKATMGMVKAGLNEQYSTEFWKNRHLNNADFMHMAYMEQEDGQEFLTGINSVIHRITMTSPQSLVGKSASKVIWEEVGKFPGVKSAKAYTDPGLEEGGVKHGFQLMIGTGGEENESIEEVTEMAYDPETYGIRGFESMDDDPDEGIEPKDKRKTCYFVPAWKFMIVDEEGNSMKKESLEEIHRRREVKSKDKDALLKEMTQFPLTLAEALMVPEGGVFDAALLNEVKRAVLADPVKRTAMRLGEIDWEYDAAGRISGASWRDEPGGRFRMTEMPYRENVKEDGSGGTVPEGLYIAATDSYDRDQTASSNGSFGSCKIFKLMNKDLSDTTADLPVCSLTERPKTSAEFYENTAKMCVLYGWAQNLVEYSNLLIFHWYIDNGFEPLLKERPDIATANTINSKVPNRYGIDPSTKSFWLQYAADWLRDRDGNGVPNAFKLRDLQLVDKLIKYKRDPKYNCDETIAFSLMIVHRNDILWRYREQRKEEIKDVHFMPRYSVSGGRLIAL